MTWYWVLLLAAQPRVGVGLQLSAVCPARGHWLTHSLLVLIDNVILDRWVRYSRRRGNWGRCTRRVLLSCRWGMSVYREWLGIYILYFGCRRRWRWWRGRWRRSRTEWHKKNQFFFAILLATAPHLLFWPGRSGRVQLRSFSISYIYIYSSRAKSALLLSRFWFWERKRGTGGEKILFWGREWSESKFIVDFLSR